MALDAKVKGAISAAAKELGQGENLTKQLVAWFEAIVNGNESLDDRQSVHRHLELLFDAVSAESADSDDAERR